MQYQYTKYIKHIHLQICFRKDKINNTPNN